VDALKLLSVFDDSLDGIVAFGEDRRYLYANPAALKLYERADLDGHRVGDFTVEPVDDILKELRTLGSSSGESVIRTPGGRLRRVRFRATANLLPDVHLSVVRAAAPLGPSPTGRETPRAELYQSLFEHAPDPALLADDERRYLDGNRAARSFLGVSREALVGMRVDDFTLPRMRADLDRIWEAFLARGTMEGVFPILLPNGLQRNMLFRAKANVRPGRHLSTLQVARSDHQATELELRDFGTSHRLTFREREVLTLLARGSNAEAIAEQLTLSAETVRTHARNAMRKLGATSRPHAIALAIKLRHIDP
jgi:HTH-type transcriptional regulator, bacterioopsin transcriptional activator and related proteins